MLNKIRVILIYENYLLRTKKIQKCVTKLLRNIILELILKSKEPVHAYKSILSFKKFLS